VADQQPLLRQGCRAAPRRFYRVAPISRAQRTAHRLFYGIHGRFEAVGNMMVKIFAPGSGAFVLYLFRHQSFEFLACRRDMSNSGDLLYVFSSNFVTSFECGGLPIAGFGRIGYSLSICCRARKGGTAPFLKRFANSTLVC